MFRKLVGTALIVLVKSELTAVLRNVEATSLKVIGNLSLASLSCLLGIVDRTSRHVGE